MASQMHKAAAVALLLNAIVTLGGTAPVTAQKASDKPIQQWSKDEVNQLLTESAWAKTQAIRVQRRSQPRSIAGEMPRDVLAPKDELRGAADPLDYRFTLRLHSALPIRQALVRREQLKWNYDRKGVEERKAFDRQAKQLLLDCPICANYYVLSVGFSSKNSSGNDMIYKWFSATTLPSIKGYVYIANDRSERRDLVDFIPPKVSGDDVYFIFPRLDEKGQPLFIPTDKKLIFRMSDNNANSITNFTLDISRMVVSGRLEF